ncbi:LOW QUALITY PROTEIN: hypothetical protein OSB04_002287 [Centaurea solstitialis]|uniref:Tf2-1-like SH3-like domain-containing protein n=1 Tax=Centaurea solstitialis TaxID=347529 RepID=A0AA38U380_9ASTR|nr:LOW QUALITY PROTEIN: hypothetical protein OSB04_002287 [Centaurea solstitialis]
MLVSVWHRMRCCTGGDVELLCLGKVGQCKLGSTGVVQMATGSIEIIQEWLQATQSRQKSYDDKRRSDLEFIGGDDVMVKVSLRKGVIKFRKRGKHGSIFIGSFRVIACVSKVAYGLELPQELSQIRNTCLLRECLADELAYIPTDKGKLRSCGIRIWTGKGSMGALQRGQSGRWSRKPSLGQVFGAVPSLSDFGDEILISGGELKIEGEGCVLQGRLVQLKAQSTVWGEIDHRGIVVIAFLTQVYVWSLPACTVRTLVIACLVLICVMVLREKTKGRELLEVPVAAKAQFN